MIIETSAERQLKTIKELAARWHRAMNLSFLSDHSSGRTSGYAQAIGLILDKPYGEVVLALQAGEL